MKKRLIALFLALMMVVSLSGCKSSDYKEATGLLESGEFETAVQTLEALGDYKDSADLLLSARYKLAVSLYESGELWAAARGLAALGDYEDSADYLQKAEAELLTGYWKTEETVDIAENVSKNIADIDPAIGYWDKLHFDSMPVTVNATFAEDGTYAIKPSFGSDVKDDICEQIVEVNYNADECILSKEEVVDYLKAGKMYEYKPEMPSFGSAYSYGSVPSAEEAMNNLQESFRKISTQSFVNRLSIDKTAVMADAMFASDVYVFGTYAACDSGFDLFNDDQQAAGNVQFDFDSETITITRVDAQEFFPMQMIQRDSQ